MCVAPEDFDVKGESTLMTRLHDTLSVSEINDMPLLTLGRTMGLIATPTLGFSEFSSLEDKTSAPDVFSSCSFIFRAHFETSSEVVSFCGYEIWRHK